MEAKDRAISLGADTEGQDRPCCTIRLHAPSRLAAPALLEAVRAIVEEAGGSLDPVDIFEQERLITLREAGRLVGRDHSTVWSWVKRGVRVRGAQPGRVVRLSATCIGGRFYTSMRAVEDFGRLVARARLGEDHSVHEATGAELLRRLVARESASMLAAEELKAMGLRVPPAPWRRKQAEGGALPRGAVVVANGARPSDGSAPRG